VGHQDGKLRVNVFEFLYTNGKKKLEKKTNKQLCHVPWARKLLENINRDSTLEWTSFNPPVWWIPLVPSDTRHVIYSRINTDSSNIRTGEHHFPFLSPSTLTDTRTFALTITHCSNVVFLTIDQRQYRLKRKHKEKEVCFSSHWLMAELPVKLAVV
jgi:hypothetical protein